MVFFGDNCELKRKKITHAKPQRAQKKNVVRYHFGIKNFAVFAA